VPRALWSGFLKLSLVSCPIALYPAIAAPERLSFRQINKNTGKRLRQQLVDTVTGEPVQAKDKGRSYEIGEDAYLLVRDEELAAAEEEARSRPYSGRLNTPSVQQKADVAAVPTRSYGAAPVRGLIPGP
jgi:non-homologous end joining protein Ku